MLSQYGSVSFQYDGEGFRRKKAYGTDTVTYYYQGGKLLSEKHTNSTNLYFLYNGNEIVGFAESGGIGYFYRKDALGNVVAVYNPIGEEVASYTYDAWGNCTIGTNVDGLAELNPIRYRGYYYDKETQLYYLQTRYYDPATGRFISPDTVNYLDPETIHGLNLYAYGLNNPVMYVDPTGHDWWRWVVGGAIVVGLAALTCVTAGGALAGVAALSAATIGAQAVGATALTTTLAFATVGAGTTYAACAGVAAINSIETLATGGTFEDSLDTFAEAGENALYMATSAGITNGAIGYFSYIETGIKTPGKSRPFGTYYNCKDETLTHYGADGKMWWSKHFTDHRNPKKHPYVPHWHAESPHHYPPRGFKNVGELIIELIERFFGGGHIK